MALTLSRISPLDQRVLYMDAEMIAQYGEYFGLAYGVMVQLWEDRDATAALFRDYPVEWTVLRQVSGGTNEIAYQGGDLEAALEAYGETIRYASEHRVRHGR